MTITAFIDSDILGKDKFTYRVHFRVSQGEIICWGKDSCPIDYESLPIQDKKQISELVKGLTE